MLPSKIWGKPKDEAIFVSEANAPKTHNMTEGKTVAEAKAAFDAMIDEYLAACAAEGWEVSHRYLSFLSKLWFQGTYSLETNQRRQQKGHNCYCKRDQVGKQSYTPLSQELSQ